MGRRTVAERDSDLIRERIVAINLRCQFRCHTIQDIDNRYNCSDPAAEDSNEAALYLP